MDLDVIVVLVDQISGLDWFERTRLPSLENLSSALVWSAIGVSLLAIQTGVS